MLGAPCPYLEGRIGGLIGLENRDGVGTSRGGSTPSPSAALT